MNVYYDDHASETADLLMANAHRLRKYRSAKTSDDARRMAALAGDARSLAVLAYVNDRGWTLLRGTL